jgi:multiple sugar transport system substrate-binding protein
MKKATILGVLLFLFVSWSFVWASGENEGGGEAVQEQVRLVHIHWTQPPFDTYWQRFANEFMVLYPNVELKFLQYVDSETPVKVKTALTAGGELDSFSMFNLQSGWFMANGATAEIIPSAFGKQTLEEVLDMWEDDAFKKCGGYYEGKYYGVPEHLANYAAWINKAHMREAGLNPDTDIPKTWEDFVKVTKKMTVDEGGIRVRNGFAINLRQSGIFTTLVLHSMMEQKGLDWTTEDGFYESLDTKEALEALTTYTNFATKDDIFDPGLFEDEREGFGNGLTSTFLTGGDWYWGVLDVYSVPREDVTPFPYPRFKDGEDVGGPIYGYSTFVTAQSEQQEWAFRWLNYLSSHPNEMIINGDYQPRKTLDPALPDRFIPSNEIFAAEKKTGAILISSQHYNEIQDAIMETCDRVIFQGMSNEESLKILKNDMKDIFGK